MRSRIIIEFDAATEADRTWLERVTVIRYQTMETYKDCGIADVVVRTELIE